MAPKRKCSAKGKETMMWEEYDRIRFVGLEAKKRFEKIGYINKNFIVERGIDFGKDSFPGVNDVI